MNKQTERSRQKTTKPMPSPELDKNQRNSKQREVGPKEDGNDHQQRNQKGTTDHTKDIDE